MLFFSIAGIAQNDNSTFANKINRVFAGVDKTKVPHHLLKDYAMEFIDLERYNGKLSENNFLHRGHYASIYNTLLMARTQIDVPELVPPWQFENRWDALRTPHHIVLSGLYYKYSTFKDHAFPEYLNVENKVISDKYVNGVWQNPYETQAVFAVSPPILYYQGLSFSVEFPKILWHTNQASEVQSLAIDFGDGRGYREAAFGKTFQIRYPEEGVYAWTYKLTLANGATLFSHSKMYFESFAFLDECPGVKQMDFSGVRPWQGDTNNAILQIDYADNDCIIKKPLIVAEGFESGLLGVENPLGENNYAGFNLSTFASSQLVSELNNYDIIYVNWKSGRDYLQRNAYLLEDIIEWVNATKQGNEPNVVLGQSMGGVIARYALSDLEERGIDHKTRLFISHDAPHQGAYIPVGILAFARHLTTEFVSTPVGNYGIPVGEGGIVSLNDIEQVLNDPGTQQLLKISVLEDTWDNTPSNEVHNDWQTDLEIMGYPKQTRNIAISNGNFCANPQPFNPTEELFFLGGEGKTSFLTDFLLQISPIFNLAVSIYISQFGPPFFLGILPGSSKFDLYFQANAMPDIGQTSLIYKGKISYEKRILWFIPVTVTLTKRELYSNGVVLPYDYYPGGSFFVPFNISDESSGYWGEYNFNSSSVKSFDFIPIPSALDVGSGNANLTNMDYLTIYSKGNPPQSPKEIPFHNFTTSYTPNSSLNEVHISFNTRNGNWLAQELEDNANNPSYPPVADCSYMCGTEIIGANVLCSEETYTVPEGAGYYQWSVSGGSVQIISGQGTNEVTLKSTWASTGSAQLKVVMGTFSDVCGQAVIEKQISFGRPWFEGLFPIGDQTGYNPQEQDISYVVGEHCNAIDLNVVFKSDSAILEYEWQKVTTDVSWSIGDSQNEVITTPGNSSQSLLKNFYFHLYPQCNKDFIFLVRAKNACGWSAWKQLSFYMSRCETDCEDNNTPPQIVGNNFVLSPNPVPAYEDLGISVKNGAPWFTGPGLVNGGPGDGTNTTPIDGGSGSQEITNYNPMVNITLFNTLGNQVLFKPNTNLPYSLDISSLPSATYLIKIEYSGLIESHNIVKL